MYYHINKIVWYFKLLYNNNNNNNNSNDVQIVKRCNN